MVAAWQELALIRPKHSKMDTSSAGFSVFFQAVPRAVCDAIRAMGDERKPRPAEVSIAEQVSHDLSFRDCEVAFLSIESWVAGVMRHFIDLANSEEWNNPLSELQTLQYAVYHRGGHFGWHQDGGEVQGHESYGTESESGSREFIRSMTSVMFLSDGNEYTGGHLEIRDIHGVIHTDPRFRVAGTIVVFPSNTFHRVTHVESGIRKTLTTWALGPAH